MHPRLIVRFVSLEGLALIAMYAGWSLGYLFLPEGVLRMKSGAALLAGSEPAASLWLERSEEHTSELQSREKLVCRLLLEKKKPYGRCKSEDRKARPRGVVSAAPARESRLSPAEPIQPETPLLSSGPVNEFELVLLAGESL